MIILHNQLREGQKWMQDLHVAGAPWTFSGAVLLTVTDRIPGRPTCDK
jgi:hypothetical protein